MHRRMLAIAGAAASVMAVFGSGTAAAGPATTMPGDGLYRVGVDIPPGIYQAPGSSDPDHACSWQRLRKIPDPGEDVNQYVVASDVTHVAPVRTLVKPGDAAFTSSNCGPWVMVPAPPPTGSYGPGGSFGSEY